jgi:hypothetical protein
LLLADLTELPGFESDQREHVHEAGWCIQLLAMTDRSFVVASCHHVGQEPEAAG